MRGEVPRHSWPWGPGPPEPGEEPPHPTHSQGLAEQTGPALCLVQTPPSESAAPNAGASADFQAAPPAPQTRGDVQVVKHTWSRGGPLTATFLIGTRDSSGRHRQLVLGGPPVPGKQGREAAPRKDVSRAQ